ncbi:unnamed protein product [Rhizoctonia solani]|uniref:Uncharacterized protein n=1 Tax=Rhizoctonia solani TaxID=456999 RepID=A0A8H3E8Q9_9AGAM|nr:unnamed protein product [Rhizoctonia solani]
MPLYMLVRTSGKGRGKGSKPAKGFQDYMQNRRTKRAPLATAQSPLPCYMAEEPQEFDEEGNELGSDAQVWKTYVRETDHADEERVDGWNK